MIFAVVGEDTCPLCPRTSAGGAVVHSRSGVGTQFILETASLPRAARAPSLPAPAHHCNALAHSPVTMYSTLSTIAPGTRRHVLACG
jgi:hypothetical protein